MNRSLFLLLSLLLAAAALLLAPGCPQPPGTVYVSFGQHVDFYHSYRGDTPDHDGYGLDIDVITRTLDILEDYPQVKMSWEFDSWKTLNERLPNDAPELFDRIKARVAEKDEVRFQAWNGGALSAQTPAEVDASIQWQRQTLMEIFGKAENGIYPQEMMHTPSLIRAYNRLGVEWVSLFYSACSFTAFRNEVRLEGKELYNPLWLETPEGDARMIVIPTYHHADVADFVGLVPWVRHVARTVEGDSLVFIAFDADGVSWPIVLSLFLKGLADQPYVKFCTPGEYLSDHEPVGTIVLRRDQADGVFDGYSSWAEKPINHEIWTAVEASRMGENRTRFLQDRFGLSNPAVDTLLTDNFQARMQTLKTTHFGLATPFLHPDREVKAREHAARIRELSGQALALAKADAVAPISARIGAPPALPFEGTSRPHYVYLPGGSGGEPVLARVPLAFPPGETFPAGIRVFQDGLELPSGLDRVGLHPDGSVREAVCLFTAGLQPAGEAVYWISRSADPSLTEPDYALLPAAADELDNGLVTLGFDGEGWPVSLRRDGLEIASGRLLRPGVTYEEVFSGPAALVASGPSDVVRERGFFRELARSGDFAIVCEGRPAAGSVAYRFRVYAGLPLVEVLADVSYPDAGEACRAGLTEAFPLGLTPALSGDTLRVWKHNYFGDTGWYDVDAPADSLNSHVTASWAAVSDGVQGLLVAYDARQQAAMAFCPLKILADKCGGLRPLLNPFGSPWGDLPDHDAARTGGNGLGETMTLAMGEQFQPSAQAYAGETESFSVALIPYGGDGPSGPDQEAAEGYSYPPDTVDLP